MYLAANVQKLKQANKIGLLKNKKHLVFGQFNYFIC